MFLFCDSFETITTASTDMPLRTWTTAASWPDVTSVEFKDGTQCIRMQDAETARWTLGTTGIDGLPGFISFWFRADALPASDRAILELDASGTITVAVQVKSDGTLYWEVNSIQVGPTSTFALVANTWYHIELQFEFVQTTTTDSCIIRVDGLEILNIGAGEDTQFSSKREVEGFILGDAAHSGSEFFYYDSVVFWDSEAGDNWNTLKGVIRMETKVGTGSGASSELVGHDGNSVNNFQNSDEFNDFHDADVTWNESGVVGEKDSYTLPDIAASDVGDIIGVHLHSVSKKTLNGATDLTSFFVDGGIDHLTSEHVLTQDVYTAHSHMFDENPEAAAPWTEANINSGEFGLQVT